MPSIQLVVQGDDFGMCHAVNEGVVTAFVEGVVTQTSVMAPCPWFPEAAALAQRHGIPTGLHQTLTCEWDHLRWRPLTPGPSLVGDDGTQHRTVAEAAAIDELEAAVELKAQARALAASGNPVTYLDVHMGMSVASAYGEVCRATGAPFLYPGLPASLEFETTKMLSYRPDKRSWLLDHLDRMQPGRHLLVTHPGVAGPELGALTEPDADNRPWAEEYRAGDLEVLCDPEVRALIERRGITLTSVRDLDGSSR